jgi:hypothetical protein
MRLVAPAQPVHASDRLRLCYTPVRKRRIMFGPDDILWGSAPGQGPVLRNAVERETAHSSRARRRRHRKSPILWLIGLIVLLFFILIPIFEAWDFISPRSFHEFAYGPHPIFIPARNRRPHSIRWTNVSVAPTVRARKGHRSPQNQ